MNMKKITLLLLTIGLCSCALLGQMITDSTYRLEDCSRKENREVAATIARLQKEARYLIITEGYQKKPIAVLKRTAEWDVIFARWAQVEQWQENRRNPYADFLLAPPEITIELSFVGEKKAAPAIISFCKNPYNNEDFSPIAKGGRSMYDDLMAELSDFPLGQGAFYPYFERATQGHASDQVRLAACCFDGRRVLRPNPKEGRLWLNRALAQKHEDAYNLYALIYAEGRYGYEQDTQKAIAYYQKAMQTLPPEPAHYKQRYELKIKELKDENAH